MIGGNFTARRFTAAAVAPGLIGANSSVTVSVAITSGGLVVGDTVLVTPRALVAAGVIVYGIIIDATHIGLVFVNPSAAGVTPASATYDIIVGLNTGALSA